MSTSILATPQQSKIRNLSRKGENLENTKKRELTTRSPSTPLRVARGTEKTEVFFPKDYVGSLKGPSQGEGSRCKAS
jgi:hypothetical protein